MDNKELYKETILLNQKRKELGNDSDWVSMALLLQDYNTLCQQFCYELGQADIKNRR